MRIHKQMAQWFAIAAVFQFASAALFAANVNDFIDFSNPMVPGRLYVPPDAAGSAEPRPLILFLHGAGETGTNNLSQINVNINNLLAAAKSHEAFLYAPQATSFTWSDTTRNVNVMSMVDEALTQYNIDFDRVYVTGLSMGGSGTWNMLSLFPDRFAAGVPIAAASPGFGFDAGNLVGKPIWAFHARNDSAVSPVASRQVVNSILSAAAAAPLTYPATNDAFTTLRYSNEQMGLHFSEWSQGGHGIWGPVYNTPEMIEWMFSKTLAPPTAVEPAGGGQILANNMSSFFPIGDPSGVAIPAGTGFVSLGTIGLSDTAVSQTKTPADLATLASSFVQFGSSVPMGVNGIEGLFSVNIGAPLSAGDPLLGENIYLVVGDGANIQSSDSLFVFKSNELFALDSPSFTSTIALNGDLNMGDILLGAPGTVFANRLGGLRAGIIAAAVNIPEPTTMVLMLLGSAVLFQRRMV